MRCLKDLSGLLLLFILLIHSMLLTLLSPMFSLAAGTDKTVVRNGSTDSAAQRAEAFTPSIHSRDIIPIDDVQYYDPVTGEPQSPYENQLITIEGDIYVVKGTYSIGGHYIQDATGGINVFEPDVPDYTYGDRIQVTGWVWNYAGQIYMDNPTFVFVSHEHEPYPNRILIGDLITDYEYVGSFVCAVGNVTNKETDHFFLTENGFTVQVDIDPDTGVDISEVDVGDLYKVLSPCFMRYGVVVLSPRIQSDLIEDPLSSPYLVTPAGTGDFPTIEAAIYGVIDGEIVELADGTYTDYGNNDIDFLGKNIIVRSQNGDPNSCVIDAQGSYVFGDYTRIFNVITGEESTCRVEGITLTGGWHTNGGAVYIDSSSPSFVDCIFFRNIVVADTDRQSSAVYCTGGSPSFTNCMFTENGGGELGARAVSIVGNSVVSFDECNFINNESWDSGSAVFIENSNTIFNDCRFSNNRNLNMGGGAVHGDGTSYFNNCSFFDNFSYIGGAVLGKGFFENCLFVRNTAHHGGGIYSLGELTLVNCNFFENAVFPADDLGIAGGIFLNTTNFNVQIDNCLIVKNDSYGIYGNPQNPPPSIVCTDIFDNEYDWIGVIEPLFSVDGNISLDPRFCNPDSNDFLLSEISPCAPDNNAECGLIGALPVGCTATVATVALEPEQGGPINCSQSEILNIQYRLGSNTPPIRAYSIQIHSTSEVVFTPTDITINTLPPEAAVIYFFLENGPNDFTIDYTIMGSDTPGITSDAVLFSIEFHGASEGVGTVSIIDADLRDLDIQPIDVDYSATASIIVDCSVPAAVPDIVAYPAHEQIVVTWTDPGALDLDLIEVWRGLWHDGNGNSVYPEYDDQSGNVIPTRPTSRNEITTSSEWILAGAVNPGEQTFTDSVAVRGVYYYEIFAKDMDGNYSPPASDNDRATNYFLGDIANDDGNVDVADLSLLGATYFTTPADGDLYNPEADVGPTDDGSGTGIPLTDNIIDFDDLMISAANYGEVNPAKSAPHKSPPDDMASPILTLTRIDEWTLSLRLEQPCPGLKGLHMTARLPAGTIPAVTEGRMLQGQAGPVFLRNCNKNGLDVSLAVLGYGIGLNGKGELLRIEVPGAIDRGNVSLDLRNIYNKELAYELVVDTGSQLPRAYHLAQNYPNPFNPSTRIYFDLPEVQSVKLAIYSIEGRQIAVLVDEIRPPGRYRLVWDGLDNTGKKVASGTYFYRIDAGLFSETRKMILIK